MYLTTCVYAQTDYSQPPLSDVFVGTLNTGQRRYGHPALAGQLPLPWLPVSQHPRSRTDGVVINIRRRWSIVKNGARRIAGTQYPPSQNSWGEAHEWHENVRDVERQELSTGQSHGDFGVIGMEEDEEVSDSEDASRYPTFYPKKAYPNSVSESRESSEGD